MFGQLFLKECRQTARSLIYWFIVLVLIFDFTSQLGSTKIQTEPRKGQENYGFRASDDKNIIMENTLGSLLEEYNRGNYTTYPIGFYKSVTLDEKKEQRIKEIISETTGLSDKAQIEKLIRDWYEPQQEAVVPGEMTILESLAVKPAAGLSYNRFEELMEETDRILRGGSSYGEAYRQQNGSVPMTYEDAMAEYRELIEKDRLTGGYARLFSYYMVIFLGILPVFLAVTRELRDKRAGMQELIYTRKGSSLCIITSRYAAMLAMLVLPILALSLSPLLQCLKYAASAGISTDIFAYVKYTFGWLLPTIMTVTAVGMFLTELTDTALAVLIQGAWWFISVFTSIQSIHGGMYG